LSISIDILDFERKLFIDYLEFPDFYNKKDFFFLKAVGSKYLQYINATALRLAKIKKSKFFHFDYLYFFYLRLWGFRFFDNSKLKRLFRKLKKKKSPNIYTYPKQLLSSFYYRNFYRRAQLDFVRDNYQNYLLGTYFKKKLFFLRYKKKFIKRSYFLPYKSLFSQVDFNQYYLFSSYLDANFIRRYYKLFYKGYRKKLIITFIKRNNLINSKSLVFYKRRMRALRYAKRR
jgi:hypothetical protein